MRAQAIFVAVMASATVARAALAPAWTVDKSASAIRFSSGFNGQAFSGAFGRWQADIRFDPRNLSGSSVMAVIDTGSAKTGDSDRDQALPTATFLAAGKFPQASFTAHGFKSLGGGRYEAPGQLTLRGITRPLTIPFTLAIIGEEARMTAKFALNRLAFG
ncbi:MAG: YceI family protein, partial [Caulobacteraceae bacterium]